ncbi:MAG: hypothetical protein FWG01_04140 [Betaproteobacteria bacterium]|nr:hypothetical protein [Betaproteobacteria bacterium]
MQALDSAGAGSHNSGLMDYGLTGKTAKSQLQPVPFKAKQQQAAAQTWPKQGDLAMRQAIDSLATANLCNEAFSFTPDFLRESVGGYLKHGRADMLEASNQAEANFTANILSQTGRAMVEHGTDKAAHDSHTPYQLRFQDEMKDYQNLLNNAMQPGGQAVHDWNMEPVRDFDRKGELALQGSRNLFNQLKSNTAKGAFAINEALSEAHDKAKNRSVLAGLVLKNHDARKESEKALIKPKDIYDERPEVMVQNAFDYWQQNAISTHLVKILYTRAMRGTNSVTSYMVDIADETILSMARQVKQTGDYELLQALQDGIEKGAPGTDQLLVDMMSNMLGPNAGTAFLVAWHFLTEFEKRAIMQGLKERQSQR